MTGMLSSTGLSAAPMVFHPGEAMTRIVLCFSILLIIGLHPEAQTTEHQRTGVESDENWLLMVGMSIDMIDVDSALEIDTSFTFEALYRQRFGLSIDLPMAARLALDSSDSIASSGSAAALGDPSLSFSCTFRASDWRLGTELSYTHPSGIWNYYEARERKIASGSGYRKLGAAFSAVRYMDPLVAGFAMNAESLFDRKEQYGSGSSPLVLTASIFATEALNSIVAISGGLSQRMAWPPRVNGLPVAEGLSHSLSGKLSIIFSEGRDMMSIGLSKLLSEAASPVIFTLGYSLRLSGEEG